MNSMPVLMAALSLTVALVPGCKDKCDRLCEKLIVCLDEFGLGAEEHKAFSEDCVVQCKQERKDEPAKWKRQWDYFEPHLDKSCADFYSTVSLRPKEPGEELDTSKFEQVDIKDLTKDGKPVSTDPDTKSQPAGTGGDDPLHIITGHMRSLIEIANRHQDDCDKLLAELTAYSTKHKDEIAAAMKRGLEFEKTMSAVELEKHDQRVMRETEPLIQASMKLMKTLGEKCPDHVVQISEAMKLQ
jgi:hypothetical protein